jgi:hypothetical protein
MKTRPPRLSARSRPGLTPPPKRGDRFYESGPWRALMTELIAQRGRRCENPSCQTPGRGEGGRVYGDHIVELQDGGEPLNPRNVQLLCARCHGRKTRDERIRRFGLGAAAGIGDAGGRVAGDRPRDDGASDVDAGGWGCL